MLSVLRTVLVVGSVVGVVAAPPVLAPADAGAVVGGRAVDPAAYGWLASSGGCTAALVAPDRLLTAAHCVQGHEPAYERWRLGAQRVGTGRAVTVADIALHPAWDRTARDAGRAAGHDLAVLRLAAPVADVAPLRVAADADIGLAAPGAAVRTVGWGATSVGGSARRPSFPGPSPMPFEGDLSVVDRGACDRWYRAAPVDPSALPPRVLCAGAPGVGSCVGDSGGPLVARDASGVWAAVGVFSYTHRCGADGDPGVYGDLVAQRAFVLDPDPVWAPAPVTRPSITGSARVGGVLRCGPVSWTHAPTRLRYRWGVDGRMTMRLPTAASPRHVVRRSERGRRLTCEVLGSNAGGYTVARAAKPVRVR